MAALNPENLRDRGPVIAINEAGLTITPWADVHYFADPRYVEWNLDRLALYEGPVRLTRNKLSPWPSSCAPELKARIEAALPELDIKYVTRDTSVPLSLAPTKVAGLDGGSNAINIATLAGARRIVLLGFDMRPGNFHDKHLEQGKPVQFQRYREDLARMAVLLERQGIEVLNATPGSALDCFPIVDFAALDDR